MKNKQTPLLKLKNARKNKKMTQQELAEKLGITLRAYQNYEYGVCQANYDALKKLANIFECHIDDLI